MIKFFRHIRKSLLMENKMGKYFKYAFGEILLVVIGILIALQINNWNETKKAKKDEHYVLNEVLNNLEEDVILINDIISQRKKAKASVLFLQKFVTNENVNIDSLQIQMVHLLTFERYFPINNAYEILKSKGLQLSNNTLTTKISRYYDYEQKKIGSSILDIEVSILNIYNNPKGLIRFLSLLDKDENIIIKNPNNPVFKEELSFFLLAFQDNNGGTLNKLLEFRDINNSLSEHIRNELKNN